MASIIKMPELVMEKIVEFSDFKAVLTLRHVCRDFRNFIDDLNASKLPDPEFAKIYILSDKDDNMITSEFVYSDDTFYRIEYSETENSRKFNGKITILENSNVVDAAVRDLELILKYQNYPLEQFSFCLDDFHLQNDSLIHTLPTKLSDMFNASGQKIKTRKVTTSTWDKSQIMSVFPFADPGTLLILNLYSSNDELEIAIDDIAKTEQWKKAEKLECDFHVLNLNAYLSSPKFGRWKFELRHLDELSLQNELSVLWGQKFDNGFSVEWNFRIKNSEEKVLCIEIENHTEIIVRFDPDHVNNVEDGAIIHGY